MEATNEPRGEPPFGRQRFTTWPPGEQGVEALVCLPARLYPPHHAVESRPEVVQTAQRASRCFPSRAVDRGHAQCCGGDDWLKRLRRSMDELGAELDWRRRVSVANGENAAPNAIPGLQDRDADASGVELASCRQPGRARADDDYLGLVASSHPNPES